MDIWVVFRFGLLWIVLLQTFSCMFFSEQLYAFLLDINQKVEWLDPRICICSALADTSLYSIYFFLFYVEYILFWCKVLWVLTNASSHVTTTTSGLNKNSAKFPHLAPLYSTPHPPFALTNHWSLCLVLLFSECHENGIILCVTSVRLLPFI